MNGYHRGAILFAGLVVLPVFLAMRSQSQSQSQSGQTRALSGKEWPLVGGDLTGERYSTLTQINLQTVQKLGSAWESKRFEDGGTSIATPVIKDGLMFVTAGTHVYALNPKTGEVIWNYRTDMHPAPTCCNAEGREGTSGTALVGTNIISGLGLPNRQGVAFGEGKIFVGLTDGHIIAIDEKTGQREWSQQIGEDRRPGQTASPAPIYWNGMVFGGLASGDWHISGRVTALDAKTGRELWHFFMVPGPGEVGHDTWPQDDVWKGGGGGVWFSGTMDPDLGLVYFTGGNAVPRGGELRPGNNLFTSSVVAIDVKTGKVRWYFQPVHHDIWGVDAHSTVLYDAEVGGRPRKALGIIRGDGYLFLLDRETGKPIFPVEERPVPQNAFDKTSPTQPFPVGGESMLPDCSAWKDKIPAGFVLGCQFTPASSDKPNILATGFGVHIAPMSYSPQTGYFYAQGNASLSWRRRAEDPYYDGGFGPVPGLKNHAVLAAIDSRTDKVAWTKDVTYAENGSLTTAGGLLFRLVGDGNLAAYNAKTGDVVWQFQTGNAGEGGPPSSYEIDGEQYVAAVAGYSVWAFKLGGTAQPGTAPKLPSSSADNGGYNGPIQDIDHIETGSLFREIRGGQRYFADEYAFNPYRARVKVGTRVMWTNNGQTVHAIVAVDGSWTTGPMNPTERGYMTFDKPGTYNYTCKEHPWSYGQVIVVADDAQDKARTEGQASRGDIQKANDAQSGGFYTIDQATRGRNVYSQNCGTCHGDNLGGQDPAPALVGDAFMTLWAGHSVGDLFDRTRTTMPQASPGSLSPQAYLDVVAYLLRSNDFPSGKQELNDSPAVLKGMTISQK